MSHNQGKSGIKLYMVGTGAVGKHAIAVALTENRFKTEYFSCVFDESRIDMLFDGDPIVIWLRTTSGQEDYDRLRKLWYPDTDAFIVCYCQTRPTSLTLTEEKFVPDFREQRPDAPFLLVGTFADVATEEKTVQFASAKRMGRKLGAACVLECSSKTQVGMT